MKDPYLTLKQKSVKNLIKRAVGRLLTRRSLQEVDAIRTQLYPLITTSFTTQYTTKAVDFFVKDGKTDVENISADTSPHHGAFQHSNDKRLLKSSPFYSHFQERFHNGIDSA